MHSPGVEVLDVRKPHPYPGHCSAWQSGVLRHGITERSEQKGSIISVAWPPLHFQDRKVGTVTCPGHRVPWNLTWVPQDQGCHWLLKHMWIPHQQLLRPRKGATATPVMNRQGGHQCEQGRPGHMPGEKCQNKPQRWSLLAISSCYLSFYHHFVELAIIMDWVLWHCVFHIYVYDTLLHVSVYPYMCSCMHGFLR